jgi:hypothetical protein
VIVLRAAEERPQSACGAVASMRPIMTAVETGGTPSHWGVGDVRRTPCHLGALQVASVCSANGWWWAGALKRVSGGC